MESSGLDGKNSRKRMRNIGNCHWGNDDCARFAAPVISVPLPLIRCVASAFATLQVSISYNVEAETALQCHQVAGACFRGAEIGHGNLAFTFRIDAAGEVKRFGFSKSCVTRRQRTGRDNQAALVSSNEISTINSLAKPSSPSRSSFSSSAAGTDNSARS